MKKAIILPLFLIGTVSVLSIGVIAKTAPVWQSKISGSKIVRPVIVPDLKIALGNKLMESNIPPDLPVWETNDALVASFSGTVVYFPKNQEFSGPIRALQIIWNRFTIEGRKPKEIDLRFDKPVLRY